MGINQKNGLLQSKPARVRNIASFEILSLCVGILNVRSLTDPIIMQLSREIIFGNFTFLISFVISKEKETWLIFLLSGHA